MKISYRPVSVPKGAFIFCRFSIAILVWLAFILKNPWILALVGVIMFFSAALKIRRAPMIVLYSYTIDKIWQSPKEILNESAMRFAHILATGLSVICLIAILFINYQVGWFLVFCFAILKTISAVGFCPASKLYECAGSNNCCAFAKGIKGAGKTC
jgi:hypothetical protein